MQMNYQSHQGQGQSSSKYQRDNQNFQRDNQNYQGNNQGFGVTIKASKRRHGTPDLTTALCLLP